MATTSSARDLSSSTKDPKEKPKKGSFLFFGRSSSKSKEPDCQSRVGIFSARNVIQDQSNTAPQLVFNINEESPNKKSANLNFLSKHFRKSSSKLREPRINGAFSLHPASEFSATIDNSAIKPSPAGNQTNRKGDSMTYNSPRIKDIKKPSGIDMQLTLGPKINMSDVNEIMNKRGGGQRKTVADLFNTLNQRKSNFTSIVDTRTMAEKPDNLSLNQFRTSVADLVNEVSIPKKSSPWRVFSFDKRPKGTFDSSSQGLASMVIPIKSNTSSYSAPIELNLKSSKQDAEIFKRKGSFTNLTIKPNYYMKSLEYYFMLERNDYFSKLYKEHFQLAFNSIKFVRVLNRASSDKFAAESKVNLKKKIFYKGRSSS